MANGMFSKPEFPKDYERVAVVECKDVDDAFRATNHIDSDWTNNPEVTCMAVVGGCRSTSVGDVVEELKPDGKKMRCAAVGWEEVL